MLLRLFYRPVVRRPLRVLTTVIGVAVGIASLSATLLSNRAALHSMREGVYEIAGEARLEITQSGGVDETILVSLMPVADQARITPVIEEFTLAPDLNDVVRLMGIDWLVDRGVRNIGPAEEYPLDEDAALGMMRGEGVMISNALAEQMELEPGGELDVLIRSRLVSLPVLAIFEPERFSPVWERVVLLDIAYAQELFDRIGFIDRIDIAPRESIAIEDLHHSIQPLLPDGYFVSPPNERVQQTSRMVRALEFNLTALSGISLMVGAVIVATTLSTSVVQRKYILALTRSLGGSQRQIALSVLTEALIIGLLGGIVGVLFGFLGSYLSVGSVRSTVAAIVQGVPASPIEFEWWVAFTGVAVGILVSLLAAWFPLQEALKTPPVQNLRDDRPEPLDPQRRNRYLFGVVVCLCISFICLFLPPIYDLPIAPLVAALFLLIALLIACNPLVESIAHAGQSFLHWMPSVRLAAACLATGRQRAAWGAGSIGVAVALAVSVATMVDSFRTTVVQWTEDGMRSDLWVRPVSADTGVPAGRLDSRLVDIANQLFGSDNVDPFHRETVMVNDRMITVGAGDFEARAVRGGIPFVDGRTSDVVFRAALENNTILINEPLSTRTGLREGDRVSIETPQGEMIRIVEAIFYDYSSNQGLIVMDRTDFLDHFPNRGPEGISIFFPEGANHEEERKRFLAALEGRWLVDALLNQELKQEVIAIFDRTFAITTALQRVASLVAIIAVLVVLFALVSERKQDLALLRALGATPRQIGTVVVGEAGLLGGLGALGGLTVGMVMGWILVAIVNKQSFGWTLQFLLPWELIAGTILWVIPACILAGLIPAMGAVRVSAREALRDDG